MEDESKTIPAQRNLGRWLSISAIVLGLYQYPLFEKIVPPKQINPVPSACTMPMSAPNLQPNARTMLMSAPDPRLNLPLPEQKSEISSAVKKPDKRFHPIIAKAAAEYKVDPALVKAIIMAESGFRPNATSKRGAMGLMQLMPQTAKAMGVMNTFNPKANIEAGVKYFKSLLKRYDGDVKLALAAYNAGSREVKKYSGVPPFKATHRYIKKVYRYYHHYRKQMQDQADSA